MTRRQRSIAANIALVLGILACLAWGVLDDGWIDSILWFVGGAIIIAALIGISTLVSIWIDKGGPE